MKRRSSIQPSLNQLAALSLGGACLLPLIFIGFFLLASFGRVPSSLGGRLLSFVCYLLLPLYISLWAMSTGRETIRLGLIDDRWPISKQTKLRRRLQSKSSFWTARLLLLAAVALPVTLFLSTDGHNALLWEGLFYFLLAPVMAYRELIEFLAPPKQIDGNTWLHALKPVQSVHWGQH